MTYDPNDPHRVYPPATVRDGSYTGWAIGILLVLLLIGSVFMFARSDRTNTASNTSPSRPSATMPVNPPNTTGSGTTSPAPSAPNR
jgi:hypothetical protein